MKNNCSDTYGLLSFGLLIMLVSCQTPDASTNLAHAEIGTSKNANRSANRQILTKNRRFVYAVHWYTVNGRIASLDTVAMTALGKPWALDTTQTAIEWLYHVDSTLTSRPAVTVGAIENTEEVWLHPPRYGHYRILELNPFPNIQLPAKTGKTWERTIYPPDYYADTAWATWQGSLTATSRYHLLKDTLVKTTLGKLRCCHVRAICTTKLGSTALDSYFHPSYGFVQLEYCNINQGRVQLKMVAVEQRLESEAQIIETMVDKMFLPNQ